MIISLFRTIAGIIAPPLYQRHRRTASNRALLLGLVLSLALVLVGCGSGGSNGNGDGTPVPLLTAGTPFNGSGAGSVDFSVTDPIDKVYTITVVSDIIVDGATRDQFTIALDGGDQNKRLRNLCSSPLASGGAIGTALGGVAACESDNANAWLFLPGDDGDDLPEDLPANFAINSCSVSGACAANGDDANALGRLNYPAAPDQTTPLARMLTYRLDVRAPASAAWSLQADEIDFPRLPTNIQTRLRSVDEGGPNEIGVGYYLTYDPEPSTYRVRQDFAVAQVSDFRIYDLAIADGGGASSVVFYLTSECDTDTQSAGFLPNDVPGRISMQSGSTHNIYCVRTGFHATDATLASDNAQFTFHPSEPLNE